jgi:hypothetical protein
MGSRASIVGNLFAEEDRKGRNRQLALHGPFILALDSFYGLTNNFSCSISCFEAIFFLFRTTGDWLKVFIKVKIQF